MNFNNSNFANPIFAGPISPQDLFLINNVFNLILSAKFNSADQVLLYKALLEAIYDKHAKTNLEECLELDYAFCSTFNKAYCLQNPLHHFLEYLKDYSARFHKALRCAKDLRCVLQNKKYHLIDDRYYSNFLKTGSYNTKNFDDFGLLKSEPVREFIDLQKDWYASEQFDLVENYKATRQPNARGLFLVYEYRKNLLNQASDLYLGKQFNYMELLSSQRDAKDFFFVKEYLRLKSESFAYCKELFDLAKKDRLFLNDLNCFTSVKTVSLKDLTNLKLVDHKEGPFDTDNFQLLDQNDLEIDPKKIIALEKNLKFFNKEVILLTKEQSSINKFTFSVAILCMFI